MKKKVILSKAQRDKIRLKKVMGNDESGISCRSCKFYIQKDTKKRTVPSGNWGIKILDDIAPFEMDNYYKELYKCEHPEYSIDEHHNKERMNKMIDEVMKYKYCHKYESK